MPKSVADPQKEILFKKLTEAYQLSIYQAKSILKTYPLPYIEETLSIVKAKRAEGSIKNLPAFTLSIIKNDYGKPNR